MINGLQLLFAAILPTILMTLIVAGLTSGVVGPASMTYSSSFEIKPAYAQTASPDNQGSADNILRLGYTKVGVLGGIYQRISYDSETKTAALSNLSAAIRNTESGISISQQASQSQSNRKLSESDENSLKQMIQGNRFFEANNIYPPNPGGSQDYVLHVLSIMMNNKTHTVLWSAISDNVPAGVVTTAQEIERLTQ